MVDDVIGGVTDIPVRSAGGVVLFLSLKVGSGIKENVDEVGWGWYAGGRGCSGSGGW